jgi:capsular polysaccharide transport system permease protein
MKKTLMTVKDAVISRVNNNDTETYEVWGGRRSGLVRYHWVLVVFGFFLFYNMFWVSDRYVTEARVYVKSSNEQLSMASAMPIVPTGFGGASQDALLLNSYIHSKDMLHLLDTRLGLRAHYESADWDFFSRLHTWASDEDFLRYYQEHLTVSIDIDSSIVVVRGQGFTPEFSTALVTAVLEQAEIYINSVSQKIALQEISFVEGELVRARAAVDTARNDMLQFQSDNELLDPAATGAAIQGVVNEMEGELVRLKAEEKILASYLNADAAELVAIRDRIEGLTSQLDQERGKFSGENSRSINRVNADFEELRLKFNFASDLYQVTLKALEQARVESYRKLKNLVVVQSAQSPSSPQLPRKAYNLVTFFIVLHLIYGITVMTIATIREHRDV